MSLEIVEREISPAEYARVSAGFEEHALEFGVGPVEETRYTFALPGLVLPDRFVTGKILPPPGVRG